MEYTFSIIKPDAVERNLTEDINSLLKKNGLNIAARKKVLLTKEQAAVFYQEHKERPFFRELVDYICSGEVVLKVNSCDNAIAKYRKVMGATDPKKADPGTIRAEFAESISRNSVHGSDSQDSAKREISLFFDYDKITS